MIKETLDSKVTDIIEPVCFTNITTRRIYSHTPDDILRNIERVIANQNRWYMSCTCEKIKISKRLIKSVKYN